MHSKLALAYLLPLFSFANAAPASTLDDEVAFPKILQGPFPFTLNGTTPQSLQDTVEQDHKRLAARATCNGGSNMNTDDIQALADNLQSRGGDNYLPAGSGYSYTWGSAQVCFVNHYLFENTHVSNWEVGWGVRWVRENCCFTPYCGGGYQYGQGDSGLTFSISVMSAGQTCRT